MSSPEQIALRFAEAVASATPVLFRLFMQAGTRDAFLVALDSALATSRGATNADLARKHDE